MSPHVIFLNFFFFWANIVVWVRIFFIIFFFTLQNFMTKTKLIQLSIFNHGYKALKSSDKWLTLRLSLL